MWVPEMNVGLDAGPIQKMCGADFVRYPDFGKILTSLICTHLYDVFTISLSRMRNFPYNGGLRYNSYHKNATPMNPLVPTWPG